jgi:uncharacterized membrane protein (UPF0127 family)
LVVNQMPGPPTDYELVRVEDASGHVLLTDVWRARSRAAASRGLLGLDGLRDGQAMLFDRCPLVHMIGMRFAIDVVFFTGAGVIRTVFTDIRPGWRLRGSVRGWRCLELPVGSAQRLGLCAGRRLVVRDRTTAG